MSSTPENITAKTENKTQTITIYDPEDETKETPLLTVEIVKDCDPAYIRYKFKEYDSWIIKVI